MACSLSSSFRPFSGSDGEGEGKARREKKPPPPEEVEKRSESPGLFLALLSGFPLHPSGEARFGTRCPFLPAALGPSPRPWEGRSSLLPGAGRAHRSFPREPTRRSSPPSGSIPGPFLAIVGLNAGRSGAAASSTGPAHCRASERPRGGDDGFFPWLLHLEDQLDLTAGRAICGAK